MTHIDSDEPIDLGFDADGDDSEDVEDTPSSPLKPTNPVIVGGNDPDNGKSPTLEAMFAMSSRRLIEDDDEAVEDDDDDEADDDSEDENIDDSRNVSNFVCLIDCEL